MDVEEVLKLLLQDNPEGVSISGGEPLEQAPALLELVKELWFKNLPLGVLLFTGIDQRSLNQIEEWADIKKYIDAVVAGPYKQEMSMTPVRNLLSSSNQKVLCLSYKITPDMLVNLPSVEVKITPTGSKLLGFPSAEGDYVSIEKTGTT
jgi:anaerobic ribonucleoside-triphosphate reductase activating protein